MHDLDIIDTSRENFKVILKDIIANKENILFTNSIEHIVKKALSKEINDDARPILLLGFDDVINKTEYDDFNKIRFSLATTQDFFEMKEKHNQRIPSERIIKITLNYISLHMRFMNCKDPNLSIELKINPIGNWFDDFLNVSIKNNSITSIKCFSDDEKIKSIFYDNFSNKTFSKDTFDLISCISDIHFEERYLNILFNEYDNYLKPLIEELMNNRLINNRQKNVKFKHS